MSGENGGVCHIQVLRKSRKPAAGTHDRSDPVAGAAELAAAAAPGEFRRIGTIINDGLGALSERFTEDAKVGPASALLAPSWRDSFGPPLL